jgi:undecaprenol kinase/diacylglycerol kinase (ATP)
MKILRSFLYAFNGIACCFKSEINFRVHCFAALAAISLGLAFSITKLEWIVILIAIAMVITLEVINTVVESLCNLVHPEKSDKVKAIKDMSAATVLIAAIISFIIGAIIFIPKFL